MKMKTLGATAIEISAIGLGCMSFGRAMGACSETESHATLDATWGAGINFLDVANIYGPRISEEVMGTWLASRKHQPVIATKAGIQRDKNRPVNNDPAHLEAELDGSLKRLGVESVDLFYIHRHEQAIPIEDVAGFMGGLIAKGKIKGWGMSEVSPTTLRKAHAVTPVSAVQNEYSLWTRQPELGLIQDCARLGVTFVAFSPLARGVFGRTIIDPGSPEFGPFRAEMPRFHAGNWDHNREIAKAFHTLAHAHSVTAPALALAWTMAQGEHIVPIPGTRSVDHLNDWVRADEITITEDLAAKIDALLPVGWAWGDRYSEAQSSTAERYC
ncbi:MAG: aldo/keto reductase [Yoonia sp.]|nr:aldo/keto reductase [Yoonia sp.]